VSSSWSLAVGRCQTRLKTASTQVPHRSRPGRRAYRRRRKQSRQSAQRVARKYRGDHNGRKAHPCSFLFRPQRLVLSEMRWARLRGAPTCLCALRYISVEKGKIFTNGEGSNVGNGLCRSSASDRCRWHPGKGLPCCTLMALFLTSASVVSKVSCKEDGHRQNACKIQGT